MSFLNGDTSALSGANLADNSNVAVNETDKYNLWENANTTADKAEEANSTTGAKILAGVGLSGAVIAGVLLGAKVFGEEIKDTSTATGLKKINPDEVKWALGIIIGACILVTIIGVLSHLKDSARQNQLADNFNNSAIEYQKNLRDQAKLIMKRHTESTDADTKLYKRKSALIAKSLTNAVAKQTDDLITNSKQRAIGLLKEMNQLQDNGGLSENIKNLESVNAIKSKVEGVGFIGDIQ